MSQNITVSWRRSPSRPMGTAVAGLAGAFGARRRVGLRQPGDRAHQPLAVAERDPELRQVGLAQIRQNVEVDVVFGEQLDIPPEADVLEPFVHLRHSQVSQRFGSLA